MACIGLSSVLFFNACSDSGHGDPTGSGGTGGDDGGATDGAFIDARADKAEATSDAPPPLPWKAVPVAGTLCRTGAQTGYAINVNPKSRKLIIFMEGGGACFNEISCKQNPESWSPTDAGIAQVSLTRIWALSRTSENNPFKDWNLVYIPYCSGDVHTGSNLTGYMGQPQVGFTNYKLDLADFLPQLPDLDQVVLSGVSAGGFGVAWNWLWTQEAFGSVPVYALDDSGPPLGASYLTVCQQQRYGALWAWEGHTHPACTDCNVAAGNVVGPLIDATFKRIPSTRFGLLSYDEDGTIKSFFAYGTDNCANWDSVQPPPFPSGMFPMGLTELRKTWASYPQVAMYVVSGGAHTFLGTDVSSVKTGTSIPMLEWIKRLIDKSDGWANVAP